MRELVADATLRIRNVSFLMTLTQRLRWSLRTPPPARGLRAAPCRLRIENARDAQDISRAND